MYFIDVINLSSNTFINPRIHKYRSTGASVIKQKAMYSCNGNYECVYVSVLKEKELVAQN